MEIYTSLASAVTVISFVAFLGIVAWAYGNGRKPGFEAAAQEPFALPDEIDGPARANPAGARR
jgi:cbb3-type cytochrome oxidase subunit 3